MSSQTKLIKDILSIYDTILENMKMDEAVDSYDNVDFKSIGHGNPAFDNINKALLQDIQTAAKNAGVKVDITTAVSGHVSLPSRHPSGNAVDIAMINGKSVSPSNRADADKFVDELVKMGYVKNKERGNPKAVLTFGVKNHDNHVHVSNTTNSKSNPDNEFEDNTELELGNTSDDNDSRSREAFSKMFGNVVSSALGIKETIEDVNVVKNVPYRKKKLNENIERIKGLL
jgi:RNA recognition motif-containing protein